mgnify:CR=1 FL=1
MDEKTKKEIFRLYFDEMYSYEDLVEHFKSKYTYAELKSLIMKYITKE